jgi:peptidoglycan hydrolase-like protein with peptidoglycan-binding domain
MFPNLSLGSRGQDVLAIQQGLNLKKHPEDALIAEDGIFGPETDAALRKFQHRSSLPATGIAGPVTRAAILPPGDRGAKVWTGGLSGEPRACTQR